MAATANLTPVFDQIARQVGQSPRSLARAFQKELGMTWRLYLRRVRILHAIEILASTDTPVTEIAFAVGYNALSAFDATFRKLTGQSPSAYRRNCRMRN